VLRAALMRQQAGVSKLFDEAGVITPPYPFTTQPLAARALGRSTMQLGFVPLFLLLQGSPSASLPLRFQQPVLVSDGQVNTSNQMAHGCDRFFSLDPAGKVIFGSGQNRMFYSIDGARSFRRAYSQGIGYPSVGARGDLFPAGPLSQRDFGTIYTRAKTNATSFNFSSAVYNNYSLVAGNITAKITRVPAGKQLVFEGLPHGVRCNPFACSLRLQGTGRVTLPDRSQLQTAIIWWGGNPRFPQATTVVAFRSVDGGWRWRFRGVVANASQYPSSQEGPNEHSLAMLADGRTVMALIRMDGGDGPSHPFRPYSRATSTDGGRRWSTALPVQGLGCARPRLHMMGPHGPLLASGGRGKPGMNEATPGYPNDVKLWVSADGMGVTWQLHSLSYLHNMLMPAGTAPELLFDNVTNHTHSMSRRETTAYTALLPAGSDDEAVVLYGLLRYWTVECNRTSGVLTHCYNHSVHGSEIRANYGFAMRIVRQKSDDGDEDQDDGLRQQQLQYPALPNVTPGRKTRLLALLKSSADWILDHNVSGICLRRNGHCTGVHPKPPPWTGKSVNDGGNYVTGNLARTLLAAGKITGNQSYTAEGLGWADVFCAQQRNVTSVSGSPAGFWPLEVYFADTGTAVTALAYAVHVADTSWRQTRYMEVLRRYAAFVLEGCGSPPGNESAGYGRPIGRRAHPYSWVIQHGPDKGALGDGYWNGTLNDWPYTIATATTGAAFFAELYALTRNETFKQVANGAVDWLIKKRGPNGADIYEFDGRGVGAPATILTETT
jgi:hypothetical protein